MQNLRAVRASRSQAFNVGCSLYADEWKNVFVVPHEAALRRLSLGDNSLLANEAHTVAQICRRFRYRGNNKGTALSNNLNSPTAEGAKQRHGGHQRSLLTNNERPPRQQRVFKHFMHSKGVLRVGLSGSIEGGKGTLWMCVELFRHA